MIFPSLPLRNFFALIWVQLYPVQQKIDPSCFFLFYKQPPCIAVHDVGAPRILCSPGVHRALRVWKRGGGDARTHKGKAPATGNSVLEIKLKTAT